MGRKQRVKKIEHAVRPDHGKDILIAMPDGKNENGEDTYGGKTEKELLDGLRRRPGERVVYIGPEFDGV